MTGTHTRVATGLDLYNRAAADAAATVIARYSTSFGLACRMLGPRPRPHVRNIYALARVADEVVDGPAQEAGLTPEATAAVLDQLEEECFAAIERGFSTNLVLHAFARTARECGIGADLVTPFFASMRADLEVTSHDAASHDAYVYGSAGIMNTVSTSGLRRRFMSAICISNSKSLTARNPRTMTLARRRRAYSTSRPSNVSTSTLGHC